jgi:hypothetical protein
MPYKMEKLPHEPIIYLTYSPDFSVTRELPQQMEETVVLLDAQPEPVYLIIDVRETQFSLDDLIQGANMATRQRKVLLHPNIEANLVVTNSKLVALTSKGLKSPVFGSIKIEVFETVEEAFAYARSRARR